MSVKTDIKIVIETKVQLSRTTRPFTVSRVNRTHLIFNSKSVYLEHLRYISYEATHHDHRITKVGIKIKWLIREKQKLDEIKIQKQNNRPLHP